MAVKGSSKADILAAFQPSSRQRRGGRDGDRARRDRPDRRAPAPGYPALSAPARVIRGRVLSFTDDPAVSRLARLCLSSTTARFSSPPASSRRSARRATSSRARRRARSSTITRARSSCRASSTPHIHYPQTQVIGSYGAQLLDWLHNYTFVEEQKFADPAHCARVAAFFLDELIRSGTTTAMVYCTVHPESVDAFFAAARSAGHAHDRGQGDDGPRRAGGAERHCRARLRREQGADRALARPRPARLRDHPALRGDLDAGATRGGGRPRTRISGCLRPDPRQREQGGDRAGRGALSRGARAISTSTRAPGFSGRARSSAIAFTCRRAKSPRSPKAAPSRPSARRRICFSAPACSIRRASARRG